MPRCPCRSSIGCSWAPDRATPIPRSPTRWRGRCSATSTPSSSTLLDETSDRLRPGVPHRQPADVPGQRHRLGRHGGRVRQRRRARRRGRRSASTACSASACATSPGAAAPRSCGSRPSGASRSIRRRCSTPTRTRRSSPSCTPRRRPACATTSPPLGARQGRRAAARRLRHVARRHPRRDRRVGGRPRLQRHPEVPRRAARAGAVHRVGPRASTASSRSRSRGTSTST